MIIKILFGFCILFLLTGCSTKENSQYKVINSASKDGLLKDDGNVVVKPIYDRIDKFNDENKRYTHPNFVNLHWLHNDNGNEFAIVKYNNKFGVINKESKLLIKPIYDNISSFFNGFARITENGKVGLINEKFEIVLKPIYESVEEFYNDVAYVKSTSGLFGCIDKNMNLKIKPIFDRIYLEQNGFARILKDSKWGFIDNKCNIVAKPIYDYVNNFSNEIAKIEYNGKTGYLNTDGKLLVKPIFEHGDKF